MIRWLRRSRRAREFADWQTRQINPATRDWDALDDAVFDQVSSSVFDQVAVHDLYIPGAVFEDGPDE